MCMLNERLAHSGLGNIREINLQVCTEPSHRIWSSDQMALGYPLFLAIHKYDAVSKYLIM